jgi:transaldolase
MNSIQQVQQLGQEFWLDSMQRGLLKSGKLQNLVDTGITGLTANPTILEKAIIESNDYDEDLSDPAFTDKKPEETYESLVIEDIQAAADMFRHIFNKTHGSWGFASLEVNPKLAHNTEGTIREARRLFKALARSNVMIKVPATPEGMQAIRSLTSEGINVNITLIFSLQTYQQVIDAYMAGIEDLINAGGQPSGVSSVASFFLSRIDTAVDNLLLNRIQQGEENLRNLLGTVAVSSAKIAYQMFKKAFSGNRYAGLRSKGAREQRPLWASTSTKNPQYSDIKYVEELIGPDSINTLPLNTISAFLDHGKAEVTIERDLDLARKNLADLQNAGIDLGKITAQLLDDGVKSFTESYEKIMTGIEAKRASRQAVKTG